MSTVLEKVQDAIAKGEVGLLLTGRWPYSIDEDYMAPANVPTSWSKIFQDGFYLLAKMDPQGVSRSIEEGIDEIASDPEGIYCALETLYEYLSDPVDDRNGLKIDVAAIVTRLSREIATHKLELQRRHEDWMGPTPEVLWQRVEHLRTLLNEDFGVTISDISNDGR